MVLLMALHSQLEYPLWYAYFLLPTAFAWGLCLGRPQGAAAAHAPPDRGRWLLASGAAMVVAAVAMVWDYSRVVAIFAPPIDSTATLADRIIEGRHSWFFAHHADYALVTTIEGAGRAAGGVRACAALPARHAADDRLGARLGGAGQRRTCAPHRGEAARVSQPELEGILRALR